jgi:hypothetical protein
VAVNAILMRTLWFLLPVHLKDDVFTLHGSLDFAVVLMTPSLAMWGLTALSGLSKALAHEDLALGVAGELLAHRPP